MQPFELALPRDLKRALDLLGHDPKSSALLAGGCDLLPRMKDGVAAPKRLIDLNGLRGFTGSKTGEDGGLHVGALTTLEDFAADAAIGFDFPALTAAAGRIAAPQVRGVATLGGNLCQVSAEGSTLAPILVAIEARLSIVGPGSSRSVPAGEFFRPPQSAGDSAFDLRPEEIVVQLLLPKPSGLRVGVYEIRPRGGLAWPTASAVVALSLAENKVSGARIVVGQLGPVPRLAPAAAELIEGKNPDLSQVRKAVEAALGPLQSEVGGAARQAAVRTALERALRLALGL